MRVIVLHPCTKFEVRRYPPSEDMAHFPSAALMGLVAFFNISTSKWGHGVMIFLPVDFQLPMPFHSRLTVRHGTVR